MTSLELLDSKRFCAFMDKLATNWNTPIEDKARLALLDELWSFTPALQQTFSYSADPALAALPKVPRETIRFLETQKAEEQPKRKAGRPKGSKNAPKNSMQAADAIDAEATRLKLKEEMTGKLDPAEIKRILAEQAKEPKARDPQLIVNEAVAEVIKPNWNNSPVVEGYRHFIVNADRKGERVSFEIEKWKNALQTHGLNSSNITFKPEGLGMNPGDLSTGRTGNQWRVMIG